MTGHVWSSLLPLGQTDLRASNRNNVCCTKLLPFRNYKASGALWKAERSKEKKDIGPQICAWGQPRLLAPQALPLTS